MRPPRTITRCPHPHTAIDPGFEPHYHRDQGANRPLAKCTYGGGCRITGHTELTAAGLIWHLPADLIEDY